MAKKRTKDGFHKKQLKTMLAQMGVKFNYNATNKELKALFRNAPEKYKIGYAEKASRGTDIYEKGRRLHGSFNG